MSSSYPTSVDSFPTSHADGDIIFAATVNDLADAVNKIETALFGIDATSGDIIFKTASTERFRIGAATGTLSVADQILGSDRERAHIYGTMYPNPPVGNQASVLNLVGTGRGTGVTGEGLYGLSIIMQDNGAVVNKAITGAANNGSGLIRITCTGHTFSTGDRIAVYGVGGTTEANSGWTITVIDANHFDLQGSTFTHAYTSGGTASNRPYMLGIHVDVTPSLDRGLMVGTAANGDDLNAFVASNGSGASGHTATDAFYVSSGGPSGAPAWQHAFSCDAKVAIAAFQFTGDLTSPATEGTNAAMLDLGHATASGGGYAIRIPNMVSIAGRNNANSADAAFMRFNSSDRLEFMTTLQMADGVVAVLGTSVGFTIGFSTSEKLGFWGATPVARPNTTGTTTGFTAGAGTTVVSGSTFTGNTGSTAYTIGDIVNALKKLGLVAP